MRGKGAHRTRLLPLPCLMAACMCWPAQPARAQAQAAPDSGASSQAQPAVAPAPGGTTAATGAANAQAPGQAAGEDTTPARRGFYVQPRLGVTETFTDNVNPASGSRRADQITELTPGIRVQADTARLKGYADYQVTGYYYARGSYGSRSQNALNAFGTLEALEKRLYVDFSGNISQQAISAFGPQVASGAIVNSNRTEMSTFRVSPYLRGRLGSQADYELRYSSSWTDTKGTLTSRYLMQEWSGRVQNTLAKARLGWSLEASHQDINYNTGTRSNADRLRGLVSYQIIPEVKASVSAGQESNDYLSTSRENKTTTGYGLDWTPTERTLVSAFRERRFFGQGHTYTVSHRMPLVALRYTDTRDVSFLPNQMTSVGRGTVYDLYYAQLASAIPDPVERARQVDALLAATGIAPNTPVTTGLLTSRVTVSERQEFSMVFNGQRNTGTLSVSRSVQSILGAALGSGDFAQTSSITQKGLTGTWAHRLTPRASLTTTLSLLESTAADASLGSARTKTLMVNYSTPLSARTTFSLGARANQFNSQTVSYRENALYGSLLARF
jgi:uncharacterized protein (PEP-CTERM system associated)